MVDRYTKAVLTIIAVALVLQLAVQLTPQAHAQGSGCGASQFSPCFVKGEVEVTNLSDIPHP
ncbi:MAG TPA: hypothetical protein VN805_17220 [Caulobacteraceae bacterium]|nr:hypothetical protein [Caulobacteraceae bacterium]